MNYGDLDPQDFMTDVTGDTDHSNSVQKQDIFEFPNPVQENTNSSLSGGRSSVSKSSFLFMHAMQKLIEKVKTISPLPSLLIHLQMPHLVMCIQDHHRL